jgi:biotin operon repressor
MSAPLQILRLLADGEAWSPEDLVKATGLDRTSIDNALRKLRAGRCMRSRPQTYEITAAGLDDLAVREARAEDEPAKPDMQTMLTAAVRNQPALQAAWSAGQ